MVVARAIVASTVACRWIQWHLWTTTRPNGHLEYWIANLSLPNDVKISFSTDPAARLAVVATRTGRPRTMMTIHLRDCPCCINKLKHLGKTDEIKFLLSR